uniref:OTU domain-containing protein n=1 Tax=Pseudo-nitzschia australis TaxID=44445 RepID=A0A7S4AAF6_9STRA
MGKPGNKKRNKNTKRGKGSYQTTDDGDEQPFSGRRGQTKTKTDNKQHNEGNYQHHNNNNNAKKKCAFDGYNYYDTDDCKKLRNSLNADGLEIAEMSGDGNCLFRSLSDQLFGDYGKRHFEVRSAVCDFMEQNEGDFHVFLVFEDEDDDNQNKEQHDARDYEDYVANMREQGRWGGNLEVVAAARLSRRNITVYSETLDAFTVDHGESKSMGPDLLVSYHDNDHYNSVRNKLHPPKPSFIENLPTMNYDRTTRTTSTATTSTIQINNNNETETLHRDESPEIECVTSSLSELPLSGDDNNNKPNEEAATGIKATKNPKRSAPCPCGSGFRYKKCCLAKQKHATRVERLKAKKQEEEEDLSSDTEEEKERSPEMFRVVAI